MNSEDFIELKGGLILPVAVIQLGCDLERRGWGFKRQGENLSLFRFTEFVAPDKTGHEPDELSDDDKLRIRKYKNHLLAVVDLITPP